MICAVVFQSAPGGEAGGKPRMLAEPLCQGRFQSAPGGEAGGKTMETTKLTAEEVSIRPRR